MRDPIVTSRIMSAVKRRDTRPELLLRRELFRRGLRYRVDTSSLVGRPDIVFPRARLAVFVDGDFWHGHGWRERGFTSLEEQFAGHRDPKKWVAKITRNVERDLEVNDELRRQGWRVLRVRASSLERDLASTADLIEATVRCGRSA